MSSSPCASAAAWARRGCSKCYKRGAESLRTFNMLIPVSLAVLVPILVVLLVAALKWRVEIDAAEIKAVDIPEQMQRAIAKEAEAIREKRARIIRAEGEQEAALKLSQAAETIGSVPAALELRRLQTLSEIGVEHNTTIVAMLPVELVHAARKLAGMPPAESE